MLTMTKDTTVINYYQPSLFNVIKPLTILSWGLGQESTDIAVRVIKDRAWERRFRKNSTYQDIMVVTSDTGAEWPSEWEWAGNFIEKFLKPNGIQVRILCHSDFPYKDYVSNDCLVESFHKLPPLVDWYTSISGIPTRARSSCTDRKKIQVIRRYINHLTQQQYGIDNRSWMKQVQIPHRMIIGFGAEEVTRVSLSNVKYAENVFPLYEEGITREMSISNIRSVGLGVPHKSGCYCCPYQSIRWYWALKQLYPELWNKTVSMESKALISNPKLILAGKRPLEEEVKAWEVRQDSLPDPLDVLNEAYKTRSCW